jgi:RNA polymerase sigma-70 factor, ECF subfamily
VGIERTDSELLVASREDPDAFTELYRRHAEDLLRYFARRTLDPEAAAELTAETFAQAFASRATYSDRGVNGVAWLYGVARHQLGRFFRTGRVDAAARRRLGMPLRELPGDDYERIEELVDFAPIREALADALETLSVDQRDAMRLHVIDGLPYAEVAKRLSCTEASARQRVSRGLRRLALMLQERGLQLATEVKTDIEYLRLLDEDLRQAAAREKLRGPAPVRRRRIVNWAGLVAASVVVLVLAGVVGWMAQGGGGDDASDAGAAQATRAPYLDETGEAAGGGGALPAAPAPEEPAFLPAPGSDQAGAGGGVAGVGLDSLQQGDLSKIIRNGSIAIRVANGQFSRGFASVTRVARNSGGFVLSSSTRGERAGTLTLRIPAGRFDDAMLALRDLGVVERQEIAGRDVTAEFVDLQARLEIARSRREVLLRLMGTADTIAETLQLQNQLDDVQLRIEQIQGQLRFINDQVAEATIRVNLHEQDAPRPRPGDGVDNPDLGDAFDEAIDGFLSVVSAMIVGLGYLIPVGGIALAISGLTVWTRRRRAAG